ncbi:hypothetical protein ACM66B_004195 [Microbotryomycetes sp. NB124-2]
MRIALEPTSACTTTLRCPPLSSAELPLAFIDNEPFLIELQGSLENPLHDTQDSSIAYDDLMRGVQVGKLDLQVPTKPILRIAHHRLEGKLVTLTEPYAIIKTTRQSRQPSDDGGPPVKRLRTADDDDAGSGESVAKVKEDEDEANVAPRIQVAGIIRKKLVFSKRPEPLIELSSDVVAPPSSDV